VNAHFGFVPCMNGVRGAREKNLTFRETFGCSHVFGL